MTIVEVNCLKVGRGDVCVLSGNCRSLRPECFHNALNAVNLGQFEVAFHRTKIKRNFILNDVFRLGSLCRVMVIVNVLN